MNSVTEEMEKLGIENINLMVHLPHYLTFDEDYAGTARLTQVLSKLYDPVSYTHLTLPTSDLV